jgi:hypothetical protein
MMMMMMEALTETQKNFKSHTKLVLPVHQAGTAKLTGNSRTLNMPWRQQGHFNPAWLAARLVAYLGQ